MSKYLGINSVKNKNEEVVQKQRCEINQDKFWEFLDLNKLDNVENPPEIFEESKNVYWGVQKEVQ